MMAVAAEWFGGRDLVGVVLAPFEVGKGSHGTADDGHTDRQCADSAEHS